MKLKSLSFLIRDLIAGVHRTFVPSERCVGIWVVYTILTAGERCTQSVLCLTALATA